jgi:SAM-dependent methyltransferase
MTVAVSSPSVAPPLESIVHEALNDAVVPLIPTSARRLLDIGCGTGVLGALIKRERPGCAVVGVTISDDEAQECVGRLDEVHVRDLTREGLADFGTFDSVVCSHALGYFHDLPRILGEIRSVLTPDGVFVAAIPNVLHWPQRLEFLKGRFRYREGGQLHYYYARFFDYETAQSFLREAGFEIISVEAEGYLPLPGMRRLLGAKMAARLDRWATRRAPGFFGSQFLIAARPAATAKS